MKRILIVAVLMMMAATVALGQAANQNSNAAQNKTATGADAVEQTIIAKEKQITEALIKKDAKTFDMLVASDGMLNGADGRIPVSAFKAIAFGPNWTLTSSTVDEPQVIMIDKDAAILTYKSTGSGTFNGKTESGTSYATTIWARRGNEWKAIFHQESMIPPAPSSTTTQ
jgi:hypothetical protein